MRVDAIKSGHAKSCGCRPKNQTHGHCKDGGKNKMYRAWASMLSRCNNPRHKSYPSYGGRGIKVCERWMAFLNFVGDMGNPKPHESLDRINNDGDYQPSNCRWATAKEQMRNRRVNRMITCFGRTQTMSAWSEETGLSGVVINDRLKRGWSIERSMTVPADTRHWSKLKKGA